MHTSDSKERCREVLAELAWVRGLARHLLRDPGLADDVVHDSWLAAAQRSRRLGAERGIRPWLAATVRNRVRRLARTDARRTRREQTAARRGDAPSAFDVVARAELHREVTAVVMQLDEPYRSAILLRYLDERPYDAIARSHGITESTARKRVSRGLEQLRDRLSHVHPGGFAAWSAAWTHQLTAAPVGVGVSFLLSTAIMMPIHWLFVCAAAVAALVVWTFWPGASGAATRHGARGDPSVARAEAGPGDGIDVATPERRELDVSIDRARRIEAIDVTGRPCAHWTVLALRGRELLAGTTTDDAGVASFGRDAADLTHCVLARRGRLPLHRAVDPGTDVVRLRVPSSARVAGEVRGLAPGASLELRLELDTGLDWLAELDAASRRALGELGLSETSIVLCVDAERRFVFDGLPPDWTGALAPVEAYGVREPSGRGAVEAQSTLLLLAPAENLVLELTAPLWVRGRIVSAATPLRGMRVAVLEQRAAPGTPMRDAITDVDGRFELTLRRDLTNSAEIRAVLCVQSGDDIVLQRPLRVISTDTRIDIGDLDVGRSLLVSVFDSVGAALPGARVHVVAASGMVVSDMADAQGRATLAAVPSSAQHVVVSAFGHRTTTVQLPADPGTLDVTLARGNGIEVLVRDLIGRPQPHARLRVRAEQMPFVAPAPAPNPTPSSQSFAREFAIEDGRVELTDLAPGVLLGLEVLDGLGEVLASREVLAPPAERCETIELSVRAVTFELHGRVRDEQGRGIPRAHISLEFGEEAASARSAADGRFVLGPFAELPVAAAIDGHLEVQHPAFVPWVRSAWRVDPPQALEIELRRGRRVLAVVSQPDSDPVTAQTVVARFGDESMLVGEEREPGRYEFARAPAEAGTLHVDIGGQEFVASIDAHTEHAELHVPQLSSVAITLAATPDLAPGQRICVVVTEPGAAAPTERRYFDATNPVDHPIRMQLLPRTYRFQLERRTLGARRKPELVGEPRERILRAGEHATVVLP